MKGKRESKSEGMVMIEGCWYEQLLKVFGERKEGWVSDGDFRCLEVSGRLFLLDIAASTSGDNWFH